MIPDDSDLDLNKHLDIVESTIIRRALELAKGNQSAAAELLNIQRTTLIGKIKRIDAEKTEKVRELEKQLDSMAQLYQWHERQMSQLEMMMKKTEAEIDKEQSAAVTSDLRQADNKMVA